MSAKSPKISPKPKSDDNKIRNTLPLYSVQTVEKKKRLRLFLQAGLILPDLELVSSGKTPIFYFPIILVLEK